MYIEPKLFDECWCPCFNVARICLNGSKGIPKELEDFGREKDGEDYSPSCFQIDVYIENSIPKCGIISYTSVDSFNEYTSCDNYLDAWEYYKTHADTDSLKETMDENKFYWR